MKFAKFANVWLLNNILNNEADKITREIKNTLR